MKPKKPAQGGPRGQRTSGTGKAKGTPRGTSAARGGSSSTAAPRGAAPSKGGGARPAAVQGGRAYASRGAGRTGRVAVPGAPEGKKPGEKTLGGEQVEGRQAVRELLIAGNRKVHEVWVSGELIETEIIADIVEIARSMRVQVTEVARKRLESQARSEAPQGILAFAAPLKEVELSAMLQRRPNNPPFLVAVDGVTDPGNLGALLRCCDGAGVHGVVLPRHRAVHITPTAAKSAAGAVEHVPMALVGGLPTALQRMRDAGIWVVGLDDEADRSLFDIDDLAKEGICLVLGAEGNGLSRLVRERCDMIVSIPMRGRLSSLNVSAAAALATYEVTRHRTR
ncbi:MAG: 23S rRNA (guanosine(2251)-2'-O)-methyltransferase RlmB [Ilumatobacteraceae bacterium]